MKIIHTFWSKGYISKHFRGGWLSDEAHFMCWALSCLNAKKIYGRIELYTDTLGYELLINKFKLPYDEVHLVFDNNIFMESIPPQLWSLSKIYIYSLQNEPFIHIDGDFIFWDEIDVNYNIIFQNLEIGLSFYKDSYEQLANDKKINKKLSFSKSFTDVYYEEAANMGIFGGRNIEFIKKYAQDVIDFISHNENNSSLLNKSQNSNCFLEQYYLNYLCREKGIHYKTIHPNYYADTRKNKKMQFNIPSEVNCFNHFLGNSKKLEIVNDYIKSKLQKYYLEYYNIIKRQLSQNTYEYYYFNKDNYNLDIEHLINNLTERMYKYNLKLHEDLIQEFRHYLKYKMQLLNCSKNEDTPLLSHSDCKQIANLNNLKIRLSSNYIETKKYSLPWNLLFFSDEFFFNAKQLPESIKEITSYNLTRSSIYCIFSYTPFEKSISSLWITDLHAYIISKVLSKKFQPISEILVNTQKLLKPTETSNPERLKSLLFNFFKEISYYGIIEFKN